MSNDAPQDPTAGSPPWPIAEIDGRQVVAFDAADVGRGRAMLAELEASLLHALDFNRKGDVAKAAKAVQVARSRLARWAGELRSLEERLGGERPDR